MKGFRGLSNLFYVLEFYVCFFAPCFLVALEDLLVQTPTKFQLWGFLKPAASCVFVLVQKETEQIGALQTAHLPGTT